MFRNEDEAGTALAAGTATPEDLNEIVSSYPPLREQVAAYPTAYPALLDWLAHLGDPAIDQALAGRNTVDLQDPSIDAATLQQLATTRLDLLPTILQHPNCYPELAAWIRRQHSAGAKEISSAFAIRDALASDVEPTTASNSKVTASDVAKGVGGVAAELGVEMLQQILSWVILGGTTIFGAFIGRAIDGGNAGEALIVGIIVGFIVGIIINYKRGYLTFFYFS